MILEIDEIDDYCSFDYNNFNYKTLVIKSGQISTLIVPDGVETIICPNLGISNLILPNSIKYIECQNNNIKKLTIPEFTEYLFAQNNQLEFLEGSLSEIIFLDLRNNFLHILECKGCHHLSFLNITGNYDIQIKDIIDGCGGDWCMVKDKTFCNFIDHFCKNQLLTLES